MPLSNKYSAVVLLVASYYCLVMMTAATANEDGVVSCGGVNMNTTGGGLYAILPAPLTNQALVDTVHSALNKTIAGTNEACQYYPAMYVAGNQSCGGTLSGSVLVALQQDGLMYVRGGATASEIQAAAATVSPYADRPYTYMPTNQSDPLPTIFDAGNASHLNGSSAYMGFVCGDLWATAMVQVENSLSPLSSVTEAVVVSNTNTTTAAGVLEDGSVGGLYEARVGSVSNVSGTSLSSMGFVWGTFLGVVGSNAGRGSASSASVSSVLLGEPSTSSVSLPWYGYIAFIFGSLFAIGFVIALVFAVFRLCRVWDAVFGTDFGQVTREYEATILEVVRERWWQNTNVHPAPLACPGSISTGMPPQREPGYVNTFDTDPIGVSNLPVLSPIVALQTAERKANSDRLRDTLLGPKDCVHDEADVHAVKLDDTAAPPLNNGMLVAQQLGENAAFDSFAIAYKTDQANMYMQLGKEGYYPPPTADEAKDTTTSTTIRKSAQPLYLQIKDRVEPATCTDATVSSSSPSSSNPREQSSTREQVIRSIPSLVPFLLISLAVLLSMLAVLLLAVGVASLEQHASHTAVVLGYGGAGCDQSALMPDQQPHQAWFVAASDRCEMASVAGASRAYQPALYMRASCVFDEATSTSLLTIAMGETAERCESAAQQTLSTPLQGNTSSSSAEEYCVLSPSSTSSQGVVYMTGLCVPTGVASSTLAELRRMRAAAVSGDGTLATMGLTPFDRSTEAFNPSDDEVRVRFGSDESAVSMRPFVAVRTVGFASPAHGDVPATSPLRALTTPLVAINGGRPLSSFEHGGGDTLNVLSARGFGFSPSVNQNASGVVSNGTSDGVVPLVQSPMRYLGVDATVFDLGLHEQFTLNFWMRAGRATRGYVLAVANDWHGAGAAGSNLVLDALSRSLSSGASMAELVGSPHFKVYSAVSLDGPSSLLTLSFGEGLSGNVSWDLAKLRGLEGRSALDGEWHMMTIQSDVSSGWRYFHLLVDSQTSYSDPAWHQCTPIDKSFTAAAPPVSGEVVRVPASLANVSQIRADTAVAYVGYGFDGGAAVAALQVYTNSANAESALRQLSAPGMSPYRTNQLVLAIILFVIVAVGCVFAVVQVGYRSHMEEAKKANDVPLASEHSATKDPNEEKGSAGKEALGTTVDAGVEISNMMTSVRQLGAESSGTAVERLRVIYPQFAGVCQAMAIYLMAWGWPEVFSDFASQMTFLFSFNFDLEFPSIPSIAMPIAQIILCGMLLVLAIFLVLHDQKHFYLMAMGATATSVLHKSNKDAATADAGDEEEVKLTDDASTVPDDYCYFQDTVMGPVARDSGVGPATSGSPKQQRLLSIRPHTRFRLVRKEWADLKESDRMHTLRTEPIYTFGMLKTNRFGSEPTRQDGTGGWYEWRCMEGVVYTPRARATKDVNGHHLCYAVSIPELLSTFYTDGSKPHPVYKKDAKISQLLKNTIFNKSSDTITLSFPAYIVRGDHDRATASSPNWHDSSIPDQHAGMPPPSSLDKCGFDAFMQTLSLSSYRAGLHLERGTVMLVKNTVTQETTFEFHCVEVIKGGPIGQVSQLPHTDDEAPLAYTIEVDKDVMYRCPRHMCSLIPYRASFHSECTTCSNSYHKDCATYMRTDGRKCSPTIALVCKEENCGYCLCADGCSKGAGMWSVVLQRYHGYVYLFWHSNINYILGFFILILTQSLFLPVVQSASMIATCHVDYQCTSALFVTLPRYLHGLWSAARPSNLSTSVHFANVTEIKPYFMARCTALKSIDLTPLANVANIESNFMVGCTSLPPSISAPWLV